MVYHNFSVNLICLCKVTYVLVFKISAACTWAPTVFLPKALARLFNVGWALSTCFSHAFITLVAKSSGLLMLNANFSKVVCRRSSCRPSWWSWVMLRSNTYSMTSLRSAIPKTKLSCQVEVIHTYTRILTKLQCITCSYFDCFICTLVELHKNNAPHQYKLGWLPLVKITMKSRVIVQALFADNFSWYSMSFQQMLYHPSALH